MHHTFSTLTHCFSCCHFNIYFIKTKYLSSLEKADTGVWTIDSSGGQTAFYPASLENKPLKDLIAHHKEISGQLMCTLKKLNEIPVKYMCVRTHVCVLTRVRCFDVCSLRRWLVLPFEFRILLVSSFYWRLVCCVWISVV